MFHVKQPPPTPRLIIDSPIGPLLLIEDGGGLSSIDWLDRNSVADGRLPAGAPSALLEEAARQIGAYLAGELRAFSLPLAPARTSFQQAVRGAMLAIPYGETRSYGALARSVGSAPRAIGGACGRNPLPIVVPCHRVLAAFAGGRNAEPALGGYSGGDGLATKHWLLNLEGALAPRPHPCSDASTDHGR